VCLNISVMSQIQECGTQLKRSGTLKQVSQDKINVNNYYLNLMVLNKVFDSAGSGSHMPTSSHCLHVITEVMVVCCKKAGRHPGHRILFLYASI